MALLSSVVPMSTGFAQLQCASAPMAYGSATPICRLHLKQVYGRMGSSVGVRACDVYTSKMRPMVIVKASADTDGTSVARNDAGEEAAVLVENLPLESNLQEKIDQKLAKKIRLRLVRKRQFRKKGRWAMATFQNEQAQECLILL